MLMRLMRERYLAMLGACWDVGRRGMQRDATDFHHPRSHSLILTPFVFLFNAGLDDETTLQRVSKSPISGDHRSAAGAVTTATLGASLSCFSIDYSSPSAEIPRVLVLVEPLQWTEFGLTPLDELMGVARIFDSTVPRQSNPPELPSPSTFSSPPAGLPSRHESGRRLRATGTHIEAQTVRIADRALRMLHVCHAHFRQPYAALAPSQVLVHQSGEVCV
jgi:hypothetical protein